MCCGDGLHCLEDVDFPAGDSLVDLLVLVHHVASKHLKHNPPAALCRAEDIEGAHKRTVAVERSAAQSEATEHRRDSASGSCATVKATVSAAQYIDG